MQIIVPRLPCIYCGGEVRKAKNGEHIVPRAIGGTRYIRELCPSRNVCRACNNGPLSVADTELCSRSPVAVAAAQVLDAGLWQTWDVDHLHNGLLLEAKANFAGQFMAVYPQVILEPSGATFRGSHDEMAAFGTESFIRVLTRSAVRAFRHFRAGEDGWVHWEKLEDHPGIGSDYSFPPRFFSRSPIADLAADLESGKKSSFIFRYGSTAEGLKALGVLDGLLPSPRLAGYQRIMGSSLPAFRCFFDAMRTLRGLMKIGFNLLAAYCHKTPVDSVHFREVTAFVRGRISATPRVFNSNGFVDPADFQDFADRGGGHSFRVQHDRGIWMVQSSFFGGRVASFVRFRGPNYEDWNRADILVPLNSRNWQFAPSRLIIPYRRRIIWRDPARIMPTAEFANVESRIVVTPRRASRTT